MFKILLFLVIPYSSIAVNRIEVEKFDRSKVKKVYTKYAMAQIIELPDFISGFKPGIPGLYDVQRIEDKGNLLSVTLLKNTKNPSNLIVWTKNNNFYVYDLVPDPAYHQDLVRSPESFDSSLPVSLRSRNEGKNSVYSSKERIKSKIFESLDKELLVYEHKVKK